MSEIACYDFEGKPLKMLYQWDRNQVITVRGVPKASSTAFHFGNNRSKEALNVPLTITGDAFEAKIPNKLLEESLPVMLYIYQQFENGGESTKHTVVIPVIPRPKPSKYEYEETESVAFTWGYLKFGPQTSSE